MQQVGHVSIVGCTQAAGATHAMCGIDGIRPFAPNVRTSIELAAISAVEYNGPLHLHIGLPLPSHNGTRSLIEFNTGHREHSLSLSFEGRIPDSIEIVKMCMDPAQKTFGRFGE